MKRKFIHIIILAFTVISCRELEENTVDETNITEIKKQEESFINKSKIENEEASGYNGITSPSLDGEDPPVKHGGHWKVEHNN